MDYAASKAEVDRRLDALEKDSHPPIQFEECPECYCLVAPGKMLDHSSIHPPPYWSEEFGDES